MRQTHPDFGSLLRAKGFRVTPGRLRLLRILWSAHGPLSVHEIGKKLELNPVTVYRALDDLLQKGVLTRSIGAHEPDGDLRGDIRAAHFSYPKERHHHHLLCVECGFTEACLNCA